MERGRKVTGRKGRGVVRRIKKMGERRSCPFFHVYAMIFLFLMDTMYKISTSSDINFNTSDAALHCVTINVADSVINPIKPMFPYESSIRKTSEHVRIHLFKLKNTYKRESSNLH